MAARRPPGTPGKIIGFIRDTLLGRPALASPWLRTPADLATRSPNPPNIPGGPAHKLAANYYYIRDHRRDVLPPTIISSFKSLPLPAAADTTEGENEVSTISVPLMTPNPWAWAQMEIYRMKQYSY